MAIVPNKAGTDAMTTTKDNAYTSPNRKLATTAAVVAATPQYVGEIVTTLDNFLTFEAQSITTGDWQQQYPKI